VVEFDNLMMRHALALAGQGKGAVEPNPMVGAVLVRDRKIVGEGWHHRFGGPHAEVNALAEAKDAAQGSTLYVSLEPCCHQGKTPPCTESLIKAGIKRAVIASHDPFPQVNGSGITQLKQAGIEVDVGLLSADAEELNAPYFKLLRHTLPFVTAKWAMTLDGRIATANFDSKWISSEASRALVHELRGRVDAIVVGIGTVLADDPLLTARPAGPRQALRIVLDSQLRLPLTSKLLRTITECPVMIVHQPGNHHEKREVFQKLGCDCFAAPGKTRAEAVHELLKELGRRRMSNVLVEGGATVLGAFFDAHAVDEVWTFIAPKWLGAADARPAICGTGATSMADAGKLRHVSIQPLGDEVLIRGRVISHEPQPTQLMNSHPDRHGS
jgi:diaminohydroxyphosphoribosylaminopyrimidine deaminase/5-amino-6-(5-phosphoribosylamino)uracil reductase